MRILYIDGSFIPSTGLAFYGLYTIKDGKIEKIGGRIGYVEDSNEAECSAMDKGVRYAENNWSNERIRIYTDSKYTIDTIESYPLPGRKKHKKRIRKIIPVLKKLNCELHFVKGKKNPAHFVVQKARWLDDIKGCKDKSQEKILFSANTSSFCIY